MNEKPTHLDLFSGIGGFALAARWAGFKTIGFCEIDKYCQRVLAKNFLADAAIRAGEFQQSKRQDLRDEPAINGPPWLVSDIRSLDGTQFRRNGCNVTLLTGGFPCQPFSCAGKRRGKEDDRHLWPEMLRVIKEARPAWVLGENVAGIIGMELDTVLSDLDSQGYACRPFVIPACGVDARHRRNRVWIVANATAVRRARQFNGGEEARSELRGPTSELAGSGGNVSDTGEPRLEGQRQIACRTGTQLDDAGDGSRWQPEPDVGRVAHGIPARVDRLRGLGNAIVPQVAYQIMRAIREQIQVAGLMPAPKLNE